MYCHVDADDIDVVFSFLLRFATDSDVVSNPYTRAHLVKTMYGFVPTRAVGATDRSPLDGKSHGRDHLCSALMKFFVDIELTGASDAFYTKYRHRFHAVTIIDYLWSCPDVEVHVEGVKGLAEGPRSRELVRFFNMVLNDMIDCLNTGLEAIEQVHQVESYHPPGNVTESPIQAFIRQSEEAQRLDGLERQSSFVLDYLLLLMSVLERMSAALPGVIAHDMLAGRIAVRCAPPLCAMTSVAWLPVTAVSFSGAHC